jgi:thioredoxin reductase
VTYKPDPVSIADRPLPIDERTHTLIIGAGPAGLAAAMESVRQGHATVLVDENPVAAATMGDDIPLLWGGAQTGATRNRAAMLEAFIASDPAIAAAFDAGVDVRLGTACFGVYAPTRAATWLPGPVAALMDDARSWMLAAERIIVATGRRDMGLAFPGWDLPGVTGATAAHQLATRYDALDARNAIILGSTTEALQAALTLRAHGVTIAAIVEQGASPVGAPALVDALHAAGIPILCNQTIRRAEGTAQVEAAVLSTGTCIPCDTIILGIGTVPLIELLDAAGCRTRFDPARGGTVPVLDPNGATTIPGVFAAGDCAGIWDAKTLDAAISQEEGRRATAGTTGAAVEPVSCYDIAGYRMGWVRSTIIEGEGEPYVCRCEEVTAREILEVRPPRYLKAPRDPRNERTFKSLLGDGAPNPDLVKRLTRAGMGVCQGRRCREQVAALLALGAGVELAAIPPATHRAPVRPIPLALAAAQNEPAGMAEHWDTWFGMPAQYRPPWNVISPYTVAARDEQAE